MTFLDPEDPRAVLLTRDEAATAARVTPKVIDHWRERELIEPCGFGADGTARYRELDVMLVEASTRRTPRLRRLVDQARCELAALVLTSGAGLGDHLWQVNRARKQSGHEPG